MTSVELIPFNCANAERRQVLCIDETDESGVFEAPEDAENIPYHAREHARPFTYGNLPKDFKTSDLHHVKVPGGDSPKLNRTPQSPFQTRRTTRPSISPSRPVLHKTPSREQFEEMLMERREQALQEQNKSQLAEKLAKEAAIQKDLLELQEKLNKRAKMLEKEHISPERSPVLPPRTLTPTKDIAKRSETPTFPVSNLKTSADGRCVSPYPNDSKQQADLPQRHIVVEPQEVAAHLVNFARDSSEFWYRPDITREEAVALLRHAEPGTFLIRNSSTYRDAYGLVLRVAKPPTGVLIAPNSNGEELVRHFLLEPTHRGVRLKGCANEPLFTSLSAFVYQHSINQLALPCKLIIPEADVLQPADSSELARAHKQLLGRGAACNVLYLFSFGTESLTGTEAVRRTVNEMYAQKELPTPIEVHFKVSQTGITVTDNTRRLFFRRHYATQQVSHCGVDPEQRHWRIPLSGSNNDHATSKTIFGFVARSAVGQRDNQCHIFCDLQPTQPASAIVSFTNKLLPTCRQTNDLL